MNKDMPLLEPQQDDKVFFWTSKYTEEEIKEAKRAKVFEAESQHINDILFKMGLVVKLFDNVGAPNAGFSQKELLAMKKHILSINFPSIDDEPTLRYC